MNKNPHDGSTLDSFLLEEENNIDPDSDGTKLAKEFAKEKIYPPDYKGPKAGKSDNQEWLQVTEYQAFKYVKFKDWTYADFDCWLGARNEWHYNRGGEDHILMNELKEGIGALGKLRKYQEEEFKIEQILGKALGYPWFKDDPKNFPNATEADGVCVGIETPWSLAMIASDKIKELNKEIEALEKSVEYYSDMMHHLME